MSVATAASDTASGVYQRHWPETTALYEVVATTSKHSTARRTMGRLVVRIPEHAHK